MSEIIYESVERVMKREIKTNRLVYLSRMYVGQEVIISGIVKGKDYKDAKEGIEAFEKVIRIK